METTKTMKDAIMQTRCNNEAFNIYDESSKKTATIDYLLTLLTDARTFKENKLKELQRSQEQISMFDELVHDLHDILRQTPKSTKLEAIIDRLEMFDKEYHELFLSKY
jgi:hypothetical protein